MRILFGILAVGVESRRDIIAMLRRDRLQMIYGGDHHPQIEITAMCWVSGRQ